MGMCLPLVLLVLVGLHVNGAPVPQRLIAFNETYQEWMSEDQVSRLANECGAKKTGFMDITDHMNLGKGAKIPVGPLPSKPTHQSAVNGIIELIDDSQIKTFNDKLTAFRTR